MDDKEYGASRTFGSKTYSVSGMYSKEAAIENIYRRAFDNGDWSPPLLRARWWQFWRPVEHTELEKMFTAK